MKTTFLYFPLLLITLTFFFSLISGDASPDPVRDIDGDILRTGIHYHILPVTRGNGGGVTLGSRTSNEPCPLDVVQAQLEIDTGTLPLTFTPVDPKKGVIRESTDLNVEFRGATICIQSLVWKVDEYNGEYVVSTGGVKGNPGAETIESWFKIEKYLDYYKFVYCPTVCDTCRPLCKDVGVLITDDGVRRLVLSDKPFRVFFSKA